MTLLPDGDLVAGGWFTTAGGAPASHIARWDGNAWSPLGSGVNSAVFALTTLPNGDVIAGGNFSNAGGVSVNRIARWDGSAWHALRTGVNGDVYALAGLPNGEVVAGGGFLTAGDNVSAYLARWACPLRLQPVFSQASGSFPFILHGPFGTSGWIQRSGNLQTWTDWLPFTLGDVPLEISDPAATSNATQFYRAVLP